MAPLEGAGSAIRVRLDTRPKAAGSTAGTARFLYRRPAAGFPAAANRFAEDAEAAELNGVEPPPEPLPVVAAEVAAAAAGSGSSVGVAPPSAAEQRAMEKADWADLCTIDLPLTVRRRATSQPAASSQAGTNRFLCVLGGSHCCGHGGCSHLTTFMHARQW